MRVFCLLLLSMVAFSACGSPGKRSAKKRSSSKKAEVKVETKSVVKTPLLAKAVIYRIDPAVNEESGKKCMIEVSEMVRGSIETYETKFVVSVLSLKRSFPWIKNGEYEGSSIYLHMKRKQLTIQIVGLSETADGPAVPLY